MNLLRFHMLFMLRKSINLIFSCYDPPLPQVFSHTAFAYSFACLQRSVIRILRRILPRMNPDIVRVQFPEQQRAGRTYTNPIEFFLFCIASSLKAQIRGLDMGVKLQKVWFSAVIF